MLKTVRVRFAPSPTGFLHLGGVRTALFNYLFARQNNGQFILRLEDTDRERFVPKGIQQIQHSLNWLKLEPDETYQQSQRHLEDGIYQSYADKLVKQGLAYYSPTTTVELDKLRDNAKKSKQPFLYQRSDDIRNTNNKITNIPIRMDIVVAIKKLGLADTVEWDEPTGRKLDWQTKLIDDFILIKADGYPTYNFANVVDDHEMKISHVMRGDEFIASTPKHIVLYKSLGLNTPEFVHLPVINSADGAKLSKRTGDTNVLDYRDKGYLPEALLNFLALLGWNDGSEQEIFSMDELTQKFSLERVNTSPAVFDPKRLNWVNGKYIREVLSLEDLAKQVVSFWPESAKNADSSLKQRVLEVVRDRLDYLAQLPELSSFFFELSPLNQSVLDEINGLFSTEKLSVNDWLSIVIEVVNFAKDINKDKLEVKLRELAGQSGSPKALFGSLRIALTQEDNTPSIWDIIYALGREESIRRIKLVMKELS